MVPGKFKRAGVLIIRGADPGTGGLTGPFMDEADLVYGGEAGGSMSHASELALLSDDGVRAQRRADLRDRFQASPRLNRHQRRKAISKKKPKGQK